MPSLQSLLAPDTLAALRHGYSDESFCVANRSAVDGLAPRMRVLTDPVLEAFYEQERLLDPRQREVAILSVLAASGGSPANLGIHVYIALAVGLSLEEIAGVFGAVGSYAGAARMMDALGVLARTAGALAAQVETGHVDTVSMVNAVRGALAR
jgi:alkylhydroperoxidase/carboxymuconolactone decarboxylase family protein YurZ